MHLVSSGLIYIWCSSEYLEQQVGAVSLFVFMVMNKHVTQPSNTWGKLILLVFIGLCPYCRSESFPLSVFMSNLS